MIAPIEINEAVARKVIETVDAGLSHGLGRPTPGHMCVEAAVCYALGLPHGDNPKCVHKSLRNFKIDLNDSANWCSNKLRAKGLRRLAIAQLGTKGAFDTKLFNRTICDYVVKVLLPTALRVAARQVRGKADKTQLLDAAKLCEIGSNKKAVLNATNIVEVMRTKMNAKRTVNYTPGYYSLKKLENAFDVGITKPGAIDYLAIVIGKNKAKVMSDVAEVAVQALIKMETPGSKFLYLTEEPEQEAA